MSSDSIASSGTVQARRPLLEKVYGWLTTVDHKRLGILYILLALAFLGIGGIEATIMRIQLIRPLNDFVSPQLFNRMFTMHGTTMIFFVAMPLVFGFANYMVPLMIGARDMAFPRLNAFSFWMTAFGALILYSSFFGGTGFLDGGNAPDVGWFAYAPLTSLMFSPGHSSDFWTLGLLLSGVGSVGTAINIVTTILTMRCTGMTLGRMPLFAWLNLIMGFLVVMALSTLTAAQLMLLIDRYLGGHFFDIAAGGSAVLWMHFFWIFGHPEVYVLILPAFAIASEIIPVFSRRVIFGYPVMVGATIAIGFIGMAVWAHHMFAVGMNSMANTFFVFTTMAIAVPTGIKIFNWLATMWGGKIQFKTPMLFCIAFLFQFLVAGLTGVMLGSAPFNWQLTGSYFVVAHFHYVIVGGILFCIFGAFYYWFPKMSGRMLNENLGKLHFWLLVVGFHLTFDFMHIPGILGMPRRIYTYEPGRGWEIWNLIVTIGVFLQAAAILVFAGNLLWSYFKGEKAGIDPWDAWSLEWSTDSPPAIYNFAAIPVVNSRRPLWDLKHPDDPDWKYEPAGPITDRQPEPDHTVMLPANTLWPIVFALGLALAFAGLVATAYLSMLGAIFALCGCVGWFRDVFPCEKMESVRTLITVPASTERLEITQTHQTTGQQHRSRLPLEIHPVSAGLKGGLAGGFVDICLAMIWGVFSRNGVWYPANLLAAGFFPERVAITQLMAFHWDALLIGTVIVLFAAVLIGLLYGAVLPMFSRHPILLGGVAVPLIGSGFVHSILGAGNPVLSERIDWLWFVVIHIAAGTVAGFVVSRSERIRTWQHLPFLDRAGIEEDELIDRSGGPMPETSAFQRKTILFAGIVMMFLGGCSQEHSHMQMTGFTQADVKHGEYEAKIFACQDCHTVRHADGLHLDQQLILAGGVPIPGLEGSFVYSANVTISSQYPAQVLDDTIRGRLMYKFRMQTQLYNGMSADDMRDLTAYLKTLRPILHRPLPDDHLPPGFVMPAPNPREPIPEHEPPVGTIERGRYLSEMCGCQECHSPRTAGGGYVQGQLFQGGGLQMPLPDGHLLIAPNITSDRETGIGAWSDDEIIRSVRTGVARDGRQLNPAMPYLTAYRDMTDQDAKDLVRFLRSVEPAKRSWLSSQ